MSEKKVLVALSGGVDSSVAALLLKRKGFKVCGVYLKLSPAQNSGKSTARAVAEQLKIPFYALDLSDKFKTEVIDYFCTHYLNGLTPNPCAVCNKKIKFSALLRFAAKKDIDYLATGHYARALKDKSGHFSLRQARDKNKDQSYFLFALTQQQLKKVIFPLGNYTKAQVRRIAAGAGLKTQRSRESQEICFVPGRDYRAFLRRNCAERIKPGSIVDRQGRRLGRHAGICFYTVGQREGLGIALGRPQYVVDINRSGNQITVGERADLCRRKIIAEDVSWVNSQPPAQAMPVEAKFRYKHPKKSARLKKVGPRSWQVEFSEPQFAVTPGQAVVFYQADKLLGGGWISATNC